MGLTQTPSVRGGFSDAEAFEASAPALPSFSFKLKVNEIKLCFDCFNRQRLDFTVFVVFLIGLLFLVQGDNYPAQMELSGLQVVWPLGAVLWWLVHGWTDGMPEATCLRRSLRGRFGLGRQ